ncbi:MAG: hypothetical protein NVSMB55_25710 [Mycobacteriales bacterium]
MPIDTSCTISANGTILAVDAGWRSFMTANGGDDLSCGVGANYLAVCEAAIGERRGGAARVVDGVRAVLSGAAARFDFTYPCHSPREERWFALCVIPTANASGAVLRHRDITADWLVEAGRSRAALRDVVTDLPNRALLTDRLEQALAEGSRSQRLVAVACLKVDACAGFRHEHGEEAGDQLLVELARRLAAKLRDGDTLGRLEDDTFVAVWRNLAAPADAQQLSERLTQALHAPVTVAGVAVQPAASIGVSVDQWAQTAEELLIAADAAMYDAQRLGVSQLRVLTAESAAGAVVGLRTETSLRAAMSRDELVLHYQPVVDLVSGVVIGVEALVRWQHPTDGLLGPDTFIPVAEQGGLIVALGAWVLEQACAQAVAWRDAGRQLDMAVNLSTRQVAHPELVGTVARALRDSGMDPRALVFEVTESAVMEDAEVAVTVLSRLAELGISLAIDDFGTGYSSLLYLKRYPIRALKADRSFVSGMGVNDEDDAIVASVISLAAAVGASCIAEGVETSEQLAALRSLGCDYGQGWLFGRAVPADALPDLVARCEAEMATRLLTMPHRSEKRDQAGDDRDEAGNNRDDVAEQRDQAADARDRIGDQRDTAGDRRDEAGDERDQVADRRDQAGQRRDVAGQLRDRAGDQRDEAGQRRDHAGDERDQAADARDEAGERRDHAGDRRDNAADRRDQVGERRDEAGDQRDRAADRRDQAAEQRDQAAEERDHAADQRDQSAELCEAGSNGETLDRSAVARREAASDRTRASQDRRAGATERTQAESDRGTALADRGAGASERTQAERDRGTALADRGAGASERSQAERDRGTALADRGAGASERTQAEHDRGTALADRDAGAATRHQAESDRGTALADRDAGASERDQAEHDRDSASADRGASATERANASLDGLTGTYLRGPGLAELEREIARVRRTGQPLTVAFLDVDGLKARNDARGHAAGDELLRGIAAALRHTLRAYDLVIRYGGDEFVCALPGMTEPDAARRFALVHLLLAEQADAGSVTIGLAQLHADDTVTGLLRRADSDLYMQRGQARDRAAGAPVPAASLTDISGASPPAER